MFLDKLYLRKIRNIKEAVLSLSPRTNVIIGENASGKTTILESIDILSRGRSFRTNKIDSLVKDGEKTLYVGDMNVDYLLAKKSFYQKKRHLNILLLQLECHLQQRICEYYYL